MSELARVRPEIELSRVNTETRGHVDLERLRPALHNTTIRILVLDHGLIKADFKSC